MNIDHTHCLDIEIPNMGSTVTNPPRMSTVHQSLGDDFRWDLSWRATEQLLHIQGIPSGNETWQWKQHYHRFFSIQPSFSLRICQLAMFGDTGGYSFFQESWSLPFAQLTACWMLQPEVERTSGCWCPLRSLPAKLSPHTWFLQWLRALLLLFYCLYIHT